MIAYIAKGLAHVGKGENNMAYLACDIAFEHSHSSHATLLLLVRVCFPAFGLPFSAHPP